MYLLLKVTQNQMSLYTAFIGVGGTLLGTILGYILSNLNRLGSRKVYVKNIEYNYYFGINGYGFPINNSQPEKDGEKSKETNINAELYIINSSEKPFNVNDLHLYVISNKSKFKTQLKNKGEAKTSGGFIRIPHIKTLTIEGKTSSHFYIRADYKETVANSDKNKFYLEYISVNGKLKRKKVKVI